MAGSEKPKKVRRRHSDEFKAGAVRLVVKERRPAAQVAGDLGISESMIHRWVNQARVDAGKGPGGALSTTEKEELARLRKEVRELRIERDILKKAAAFFAKESA